MPNRPVYPTISARARALHAVLATATGIGLLTTVVSGFQTTSTSGEAGPSVATRAACERRAAPAPACRAVSPRPDLGAAPVLAAV